MNKQQSAYNITAPCVISAPSPGNPITGLVGFITLTPGSAGSLVFNDAVSVAAASTANEIISYTYQQAANGDLPIGAVAAGGLPITTGLVVSQVPTGMVLVIEFSIYVPG
jgi:hypothetical protein